jgi:hypothetical protein
MLVRYCGVYGSTCSPAIADYWNYDGLNPKHSIAQWMSQTRFEQIKRYFHVSSPGIELHTASGRRLWHVKVDPVVEQLRNTMLTNAYFIYHDIEGTPSTSHKVFCLQCAWELIWLSYRPNIHQNRLRSCHTEPSRTQSFGHTDTVTAAIAQYT